jgi:hypothetical protein
LFDANIGGTTLAVTSAFTEDGGGQPISALMRFRDQNIWFLDPNPLGCPPDAIGANTDMLSVAEHELGHAVGFTRFYTLFAGNIGAAMPDGRRPFNCVGTPNATATLVPQDQGTHSDPATHPGDMMVPTIPQNTRRLISQLDMDMLGCTFMYSINNPPVANAGSNATVECTSSSGAMASLNGAGSSDPDGDPLCYLWTAAGIVFDNPFSATPSAAFPFGTTTVTLTVDDGILESTSTVDITVEDTTPPLISCPADIEVECTVTGGTPKNDPQLMPFFAGVSANDVCDPNPAISDDAPAFFPLGTTVVEFTATDASGNQSTCMANVMVVDTTPPTIAVDLDPEVLWPPNHKLVDIEATVTVEDICDPSPIFILLAISSDEPENDGGDGDTAPDIVDAAVGTADVDFKLRAERSGLGDGRKYTIVYLAQDASGNVAVADACVTVPHDRSGMAMAAAGFNSFGTAIDLNSEYLAMVVPAAPLLLLQDTGTTESRFEENSSGNTLGNSSVTSLIDLDKAYLGNTRGVISPLWSWMGDVDGDGHRDLVFFYPSSEVEQVRLASDAIDGPVGLHYQMGEDYSFLVPDIFNVGLPITLPPDAFGEFGGAIASLGEENLDGKSEPSVENDGEPAVLQDIPKLTRLAAVAPNPFHKNAVISFDLSTAQRVNLAIFDPRGRLVRQLLAENRAPGRYQFAWDGRDSAGRKLTRGVYFVQFVAGDVRQVQKAVILK